MKRRAYPERLGAGWPPAQVAHRQQAQEGGDVVAARYQPALCRLDPEPGEHKQPPQANLSNNAAPVTLILF